jgi:16S rRNA (cytidine1402-2'-O)-methyltransferase
MGEVYLIPTVLAEDGYSAIHPGLLETIEKCEVFFVENERTTRRYFKQLWKEYAPDSTIVIDNYKWEIIDDKAGKKFLQYLGEGKKIGILSEAGCPGIADPGQSLVQLAQKKGNKIIPLTGPSSVFLALMASGMNGQNFHFHGYLPIETGPRAAALRQLEAESAKKGTTQIFIETPYRNNQMVEAIISSCAPTSRLCIAVNITAVNESIQTRTVAEWAREKPDLHKKPTIFILTSQAD